MNLKEYKYKINGTKFSVKVGDIENNTVHVEVNGTPYTVELDKTPTEKLRVSKPVRSPQSAPRTETGKKVISEPPAVASGGYTVKAPLPGTIMSISVKVGDEVKAGDTVCILEAMKMENDVHTPKGGKVKEILVKPGDAVPQEGNIMILE